VKKTILLNIIIILLCSIGSAQECSGPLNITLDGSPTGQPLTIDAIYSNVYCKDSDQGAIELQVLGGTPDYTCIWNTGFIGEALYNLGVGTYSVTVTDSNNCTLDAVIHIIQQHPLNQNLFLADYDCCGYCKITDNGATYIYQGADYIIHIKDINDGIDVGSVEACIELTTTEQDFNGRKLLKRHWEINTSEQQSIVRLYFSNEELQSLLEQSNYEKIDDNFISNLSVIKLIGKKKNLLSYETLETYNIQSLHQFGNTDVMYVEIPHHGIQDKKIGYVLAIKPRAEINLERLEPVAVEEVIGKYTLKTNPVENQIEILASIPDETIYGQSYIVDQLGQELKVELLWDQSLHRKQINVSDLVPGIYFYVVWAFNTNEKRVIKFIKI
jgi:hypothetical protein